MVYQNMKVTIDTGYLRLKSCKHGLMLYLPHDQYIGQALDLCGEFSEGEVELFRGLVQPYWVVLDIGANHGAHTIALAKMAKTVYAFEPQRILFQILCANVALNGLNNVYTYQVAVGSTPGSIGVPILDYSQPANYGAVSLGSRGEEVLVQTLDSLNLDCDFIKIDVEGMEGDVLAGATSTISRCRPILYMENDRVDKSCGLIRQVFNLGYRCYWHLPPYFNQSNYFGCKQNPWPNIISVNMLCIPKEKPQALRDLREVESPTGSWREN